MIRSYISNIFGKHSNKVWRAFFTSVPARLFGGMVTIPLVGWITGAYKVAGPFEVLHAVFIYSAMGFAWALLVEFQWLRIKKLFKE